MTTITLWPGLTAPNGRRITAPWSQVLVDLATPREAAEKSTLPGWSLATFREDRRAKANVEAVHALVLDDDSGTVTLDDAAAEWTGCDGLVFTTHSHTPERPRHRTILALSRSVTADEYERLYRWACSRIPTLDPHTCDASRLWFVPAHRPGAIFETRRLEGGPLDVDAILSQEKSQKSEIINELIPGKASDAASDRARLASEYLRGLEPARTGDHGGTWTFIVAQKIGLGFDLDQDTTYDVLQAWNARCEPPWDEAGLRRKVREAFERGTAVPRGSLLPPSGPGGADFRIMPTDEIFAPMPPVQWIVEGIELAAGAPTMVAGYGFSGKTIALQSAFVSLAMGTLVWGFLKGPSAPCAVVHLDWEQGPRLTRDRYQRLARGLGTGVDGLGGRLGLVSLAGRYLDGSGAESALAKAVDGRRVAIVDSLRAACPTLDENASDIRAPLDMMGRVSDATGCAFVVIHHARKPSKDGVGGAKYSIRGSGALYDACQSSLVFSAAKGEPPLVEHEKARITGRCADPFELVLEDVGANALKLTGRGIVVESEDEKKRKRNDETKAKIVTAMKTIGIVRAKSAVFSRVGGNKSHFDEVWASMLDREITDENKGYNKSVFYLNPVRSA